MYIFIKVFETQSAFLSLEFEHMYLARTTHVLVPNNDLLYIVINTIQTVV